MIQNSEVAHDIAGLLLECGAVKLQPENPFTWASGWKSPIYCDNRLTLSFPDIRKTITIELVKFIESNFPDVDCIAGVATAGIPQAVLVADALDLPAAYVRSAPKDHGMGNQIEGNIESNWKVVVIEDLISTGGSSAKAVEAIIKSGAEVLATLSTFSYGFQKADEVFEKIGVPYYSLSDYDHLLEAAIQGEYIKESVLEKLGNWRNNPANWLP